MGFRIRKAARAIIVTPQSEVLLIRMAFPWRDEHLWIFPGGGIEQGEDAQSAVVREIYEETGATELSIVGEAWRSESVIEAINTHLKQRYFLVFADRFEPKPSDLSEREMEWVCEYRWWSIDELKNSNIVMEPVRIADELGALIKHGLPVNPIKVDAV